MKEKVSVLMSVYNTPEDWLRQAIESVLNQSLVDMEFVIVVDCPTDNSKDVIEEFAGKDKRIKIIYNEINLGLTASLNKGIKQASGKYIARMDSDDIADENRIKTQLEYLENKQLDIVGARIVRINENNEIVGVPTMKYDEKVINYVLKYTDCVPHPTWLVRKEVYMALEGYRNIKYCEDYDFLLRAAISGYKIGMCDEVLLKYRINTSGITRSNSLRQFLSSSYLKRNRSRIDSITQSEIDNAIDNRITEKKSSRFEESIGLFRMGIEGIKEGKTIFGVKNILAGLLKTPYAIYNFLNILNVHRIVKQRSSHAKI